MRGCKLPIRQILRAAAVLGLSLPGMALGEFGVCPPYSKTFGPDDSNAEIVAFIEEINARPGGGTLILEPGVYDRSSIIPIIGHIPITGVVCIRASEAATVSASGVTPSVRLYIELPVNSGGILTLRDIFLGGRPDRGSYRLDDDWTSVSAGATLFTENVSLDKLDPDDNIEACFVNAGFASLRNTWIGGSDVWGTVIENTGTLVMAGGGVSIGSFFSFEAVRNSGYTMLDRVSIRDNCGDGPPGTQGIVNLAGGALNMTNSAVVGNGGDCTSLPSVSANLDVIGVRNDSGGFAHIVSSTIADNVFLDDQGNAQSATGIRNDGVLELEKSIVTDTCGPVTDLGYNVGTCAATQPTSIEADPLFVDQSVKGSIELGTDSPAIDRVPVSLCSETDMLSRARTDGNGDGIVACDSGALEYGYAGVEVMVRTWPYWSEVGEVDVSTDTNVTVMVASGGPVDPTGILFDSVDVEGFDRGALRGPVYRDYSRDGLLDYVVWYRLDRMPPLACGEYDQTFSAMTSDGRMLTGQLRFVVTGCAL